MIDSSVYSGEEKGTQIFLFGLVGRWIPGGVDFNESTRKLFVGALITEKLI